MTDRIVRIKSSRPGYRRGGLEHGPQWVEIDTTTLTRDQQRAILADVVLTVEGREADGSWTPLTTEIREGLVSFITGADEIEGVETPFEVDPGVIAKAEDWDALLAQISLHQADLEVLALWPVDDVDDLVASLIERLLQAGDLIAAREADLNALKARFDSPLQLGLDQAFAAFRVALQDPAKAKMAPADLDDVVEVVINAEIARIQAEQNNPSDVQPGGGVGDPADPAGGEASRQEGPETAGNTSSADGADDAPVDPAPKPNRQAPAKSKAAK